MAITRVASQTTTATGSVTATATFPATPKAGNLLICVCASDAGGGTGVPPGFISAVSVANTATLVISYKVASGTESGVTAGRSLATATKVAIFEYTGFNGSPVLDKSTTSSSTAVTIPTGTTTGTASNNELVFVAGTINTNNTLTSWSNSFVSVTSVNTSITSCFTAEKIVSTTGTQTSIATTTPTSAVNAGGIVTFRSGGFVMNNYQTVKAPDGISASGGIR